MGYFINITDADFVIPAADLDAAYVAACELNKLNSLKHGGTYSKDRPDVIEDGEASPWMHFSWMPWNYPEVYGNINEILEALGFDIDINDDGDVRIVNYSDKGGDEDAFLAVLAPYVVDGSFIEWQGEDGAIWRNFFKCGKFISQSPTITWN